MDPPKSTLCPGYCAVVAVLLATALTWFVPAVFADGGTNYVWQASPSPTPPYTSWETAAHSISNALAAAQSNNTVLVTNGTYTVTDTLWVTNSVTLASVNGRDVTRISGGAMNDYVVLFLPPKSKPALLDGFTVDGGSTRVCCLGETRIESCSLMGDGTAANGRGVISLGPLEMANTLVRSNATSETGGGLLALGHATMTNCEFRNNSAESAGACLFNQGVDASDCVFEGNEATDASAGAVLCIGTTSTFYNCTFESNQASQAGGALMLFGCGVLHDCHLLENTAGSDGGSVFCLGSCAMNNCQLENNEAGNAGGGLWLYGHGESVISGCNIVSNRSVSDGGGILSIGNLACQSATISDNTGRYGGGLFALGTTELNDCVMEENRGEELGGAIFHYGTLSLFDSALSSNSATGDGGAVFGVGNKTLLDGVVIQGNRAGNDGGGVFAISGSIQACRIVDNEAGASGGGVAGAWMSLSESAIMDNRAVNGGGLSASRAHLDRCEVRANRATRNGGGIKTTQLDLHNCLVTDNVASNAGGIWSAGWNMFATATITTNEIFNSTIAGNRADTIGGFYCESNTVFRNTIVISNLADSGSNNYVGGPDTVFAYSCMVPLPVGAGNLAVDPQFEDPDAGNYELATGSPCIDCGTNLSGIIDTDLLGIPRPSDGDSDLVAAFDMGAYEKNFDTHFVSPAGRHAPPFLTWADAATNIQAAVDVSLDGHRVFVSNGTYAAGTRITPDWSLLNRLVVTNAVRVVAVNGPEVTSIVGAGPNGAGAVRCAYLSGGAVLSGFGITNGHTLTSGGGADASGGGIFIDEEGSVEGCVITGCECKNSGAGIAFWAGGAASNCVIRENTANYGGGALCYFGGRMVNCLVTRNYGLEKGGGVYGYTGTASAGELDHCTIADNEAAHGADGIYFYQGGRIRNTIIHGNGTEDIYTNHTPLALVYCCSPGLNGNGNTSRDPLFVDATGNDFHLVYGSPCIDTGTNLGSVVATDLEQRIRPLDGDDDGIARFDMGVYETVGGQWPDHYVASAGSNIWPYLSWNEAATNIQDAVDAAGEGHTVWVSNGVYEVGTRLPPDEQLPTRVVITGGVRVVSINGPDCTSIVGAGPDGADAVRCAYIAEGATLEGFALTNGHTFTSGADQDRTAGGCVVKPGGRMDGCIVQGCSARYRAGGVDGRGGGVVRNCLVRDNTTIGWVGGVMDAIVENCTIVRNHSNHDAGGTFSGSLRNSIVFANSADGNYDNAQGGDIAYCCIPGRTEEGCITNAPGFVDFEANDFRLTFGSPCVDSGFDMSSLFTDDIDGNSRPEDGDGDDDAAFDMGCYEMATNRFAEHFVWSGGAHISPFLTWVDAATNIQDAVDVAPDGHIVWITNGTYVLSAAIHVTHATSLRGISKAADVVIDANGTVTGERCLMLACSNAAAEQVTLTQGIAPDSGGGAYLAPGSALRNCIVYGNKAKIGGGVLACIDAQVINCLVWDNRSTYDGAGIYLEEGGTVLGCTIAGNIGDGIFRHGAGIVKNTIAYHNRGGLQWECSPAAGAPWMEYSCTTPDPGGIGNVTNDPVFLSKGSGNFHLEPTSPCVDTGLLLAELDSDLDGYPRPIDGDAAGGAVHDMGAYEYSPDAIVIDADSMSVYGEVTEPLVTGVLIGYFAGPVIWTNVTSGTSGSFVSQTPWSIHVPVLFGANQVTVGAQTLSGSWVSDSVIVTRTQQHGGHSPIHYVDLAGRDTWPYTNWTSAATCIQDAVNAAVDSDTVLVAEGVYQDGSTTTPGHLLGCRLVLTNNVTVRSVSGPGTTIIRGSNTVGISAVRPAYLSAGCLSGFTLEDGGTRADGHSMYDQSGGGLLVDQSGVLSNCVVRGCTAADSGGGVAMAGGGLVVTSVVYSNNADHGGGVFIDETGELVASLFYDNRAHGGGGAIVCNQGGTITACTISENTADGGGGTLLDNGGTVRSSIIIGNHALSTGDNTVDVGSGQVYSFCCISPTPSSGTNIIDVDPGFLDAVFRDFHLDGRSDCIDAGDNGVLTYANTDLDGVERPLLGRAGSKPIIDIGCFEFVTTTEDTDRDGMLDSYEVEYGLDPIDDKDATENPDEDPHSNLLEFYADTDPHDGTSYLKIDAITNAPPVEVYFSSSSNCLYGLWIKTNLLDAVWGAVEDQTNHVGRDGLDRLTDERGSGIRYYRIRARRKRGPE